MVENITLSRYELVTWVKLINISSFKFLITLIHIFDIIFFNMKFFFSLSWFIWHYPPAIIRNMGTRTCAPDSLIATARTLGNYGRFINWCHWWFTVCLVHCWRWLLLLYMITFWNYCLLQRRFILRWFNFMIILINTLLAFALENEFRALLWSAT